MGTGDMCLIMYIQTGNSPILVRPLLQEMIQAQVTPPPLFIYIYIYLSVSSSAVILMTSCALLVDGMLVSLHEPGTTPGDICKFYNTMVPFLISASSLLEIRAHLH